MAKDKGDRSVNPAAAARKAEKARAIKKGKAAVAAQRTERLAKTNPARIERQLADLHARQAAEGSLPARDRRQLAELERDLERITKARAEVGGGDGGGSSGGRRSGRDAGDSGPHARGTKRARDGQERSGAGTGRSRQGGGEPSASDTDDSVRNIPMPRDTPPPVPVRRGRGGGRGPQRPPLAGSAEATPAAAMQPPMESKTVYEAKPVIKDLQREAASFVPSAVRKKITESKGQGGRLLEAEEMEALEAQGYGVQPATNRPPHAATGADSAKEQLEKPPRQVEMEEVPDEAL